MENLSSTDGSSIASSSLIFVITELADPGDDDESRYIELYSPNGSDHEITDDIWLIRWIDDNIHPDIASAYYLKGLTIGSNGFIVVCNDDAANDTYDGACDKIAGSGSPADFGGDDQIAVIVGDPSKSFMVIDIFGVPGEDGTGTNHDFKDSKAVRKSGVP